MAKIKLQDLCENLWEGLGGQVSSVETPSDNQLVIVFRCKDWSDENLEREFKIICDDVVERRLLPSPSDELWVVNDHVLLWQHNRPSYNLFYGSAPENGHEILGILAEAHEATLNSYSNRLVSISAVNFIKHCNDGYGLLARGPEPLLEIYQRAISDKMKTHMVPSYKPKGGYSCLFFECGHVIAQSFRLEENSERRP